MTNELPKIEATAPIKKKLGRAGMGRPKGVPNKTTSLLKDQVLAALDGLGGVEYLIQCGSDPRSRTAFLGLVGKVLPMAVTGPDGGAIQTVTRIELVAMRSDD
jgi:hypothetical protein